MNQVPVARIIAVVALILVAGGALTYAVLGRKPIVQVQAVQAAAGSSTASEQATTQVASTVSTNPASEDSSSSSDSEELYKDGTYSAVGSYISPGGEQKIGVTVTLQDDIITAASVTPEPIDPNGRMYQGMFASSFQPLVVGMNISDVHLTKVSGSSLTSGGFNQALAEIEAEAKV